MWKFAALIMCLNGYCLASPVGPKRNMPIVQQRNEATPLAEKEAVANINPNEMIIMSSLSLPSNATSIRADITDGFSCENKTYGYYADVDNDCQIFHVCLPVTYADGKENTFRWSFICPEETIFSQDSFTCMRPDDMTITCEESYQYYELNRNFGVIDSLADKENNNEAAAETAESNETILEAVKESAPAKPIVEEEEERVIEQSKPINVQKPTRRKPSISYATQKNPTNSYHLRKIPPVHVKLQTPEAPAAQASEDVNENIKPVEGEKIKPDIKHISRRPLPAASNSFKHGIQEPKPESVVATRTELFNQMRKRPTLISKKPAEQLEEDKQKEQPKIEPSKQNFSPVASDMSISNSGTQEADAEIEASETNHAFVESQETNETVQNVENTYIAEEPVKVLEAFEEIPAVVSEVVKTPNAEEEETKKEENLMVEKTNFADEPQITEEVQSAEEEQTAEEMQETQVAQEAQEINNTDETKTAEENQAAEETTDIEETQTAKENQAAEETPQVQPFLRTSAEQIENVEDSKTVEVVPQETQAAEETEISEVSNDAEKSQAAKETNDSHETQVVQQTQVLTETQDMEKTQMADEPQILEETQSAEENTSAIEDTETGDENQSAEEEISEIQQSLRTSAEELLNSEKHHVDEESPMLEADKIAVPEQTESVGESQVVEIAQSAEETQESQTDEEIQVPQEVQNTEESKESDHNPDLLTQEAEVHTPILTVEEPEPIVHNIEESKISVETGSTEDSKPVEENIAEPVIFKENPEESINAAPVQTIEQMESEKPAEAPETMPATEEMSHPNAIVQQMYEDMDMNKKFKPVDPLMAQEAEQLIVDFINTLRKNDFTNETPGMHMEHHVDEASEQAQSHEDAAEVQETENVENHEESQDEDGQMEKEDDREQIQDIHEIEEPKLEPDTVAEINEDINDVADVDALKSLETQKLADVSAEAINVPQEMYQIPVQVITAPIEKLTMKNEEMQSAETPASTEEKIEEVSPAKSKDGYKPLSIDDIVELVKERLDHMPKTEMETPMQLEQVLDEAQKDKAAEEKMEAVPSIAVEEKQPIGPSEEEIIVPIYQRIGEAPQVDVGVQSEDLEQVPNEEQSEVANVVADVNDKTKRSYRSRSELTPKLDSRKRRFFFKTDLS